jgi:glycosyltransferase involved in cell wall biosynthesis
LKAARQLRELLHNRRIDIVHTFHESSDLWGGMIAKLSGVPILISSRRDMGYLRSVKHEIAYRVFGNCFDKVLAVSERVRERCISAERLTPSRVTTVYNGICLAEIDSVCTNRTYRSGLGVPMEAQLVAAVGNIRRIKGFDVLIRAAQLVCMEYPKAAFLLVGEPSDRECQAELRDMVNNLGLSPNVRFLGSRTDIVPILKASDVFCLPSRSEGFSNSLIEAMACRLPCVATDVGGNGEAIMDGINGYLVPPESPQALAGAILQFLQEPDRAQSMGREARGTVENRFTFEGMIERLVAMYEELAQSAAKRIN